MEAAISEKPTMLHQLHEWQKEHISERMFMIILALIVGFFAAVAAFFLHWIINQIVILLTISRTESRVSCMPSRRTSRD